MQLKSGEEIITKGNKSSAKEEPFPRGVSKPAQRALAAAGYTRLDNLTNARERDLAALHGMGPEALTILKESLKPQGKALRA
jgi:hypothetical protein